MVKKKGPNAFLFLKIKKVKAAVRLRSFGYKNHASLVVPLSLNAVVESCAVHPGLELLVDTEGDRGKESSGWIRVKQHRFVKVDSVPPSWKRVHE